MKSLPYNLISSRSPSRLPISGSSSAEINQTFFTSIPTIGYVRVGKVYPNLKKVDQNPLMDALDEYQAALAMHGDEKAFKLLYQRWHPRLLRFAYRLTHNVEDAQDVIQEAAIAIAKNLHRLEKPASFAPWAYTIVRRRAIDHVRKAVRSRQKERDMTDKPVQDQCSDLDQSFALTQALQQMSDTDRSILKMFYLDGMTGPELASAIGVPLGTLKSRLHSARIKLKRIYESSGNGEINVRL